MLTRYLPFFVALLGLTGCGGIQDIQNPSEAAVRFREEFAVTGAEIGAVRCRVVNVADTSTMFFSFECSESAMQDTVQGFRTADRVELVQEGRTMDRPFDLFEPNPNSPNWWPDLKKVKFDRVYYRRSETRAFNGYQYIIWDAETKRAYAESAKWR